MGMDHRALINQRGTEPEPPTQDWVAPGKERQWESLSFWLGACDV